MSNGRETWLIWSPPQKYAVTFRYAVTFQKGEEIGARAFRTVYVSANDQDSAIDIAEKDERVKKGFRFSSVQIV